jgi:tetratricopeptide (TPR) repeat protein
MDMIANLGARLFRGGFVALVVCAGICVLARAEVTNSPPQSEANASAASQDSLRNYLQIQEQLHNTQVAIEQYRQAAEAAVASNSQALDARLGAMERTLASQQVEELKGRERSERMLLLASGTFAGVGFLVLLIAAFLQLTAVNRLAATAASFAAHPAHALGMGDAQLLPSRALQQSTASFLGIIERLEQRIHEMEATTGASKTLPENTFAGAGSKTEAGPLAPADKAGEVNLLANKVHTLLKLDKPEAALACLDELLALDPGNADALVKKGAALERLQRFDEAIQYYDCAIAQDNSMTMAYLYKGGVYNRLERYSEALACYEQALKTRSEGHAANVIID